MFNLTVAIDRFRTEHPEYAQTERDLEIARAAILCYQRATQAMEPQFQFLVGSNSSPSASGYKWCTCIQCGGSGHVSPPIGRYTYTGSLIITSETCPTCGGLGGRYE